MSFNAIRKNKLSRKFPNLQIVLKIKFVSLQPRQNIYDFKTLYILMGTFICFKFDIMNLEWLIVHVKGSQVRINFLIII